MAEYPIIIDPAAMRSLIAGRKTQVRVLDLSPLRGCRPGDRLWVKERCIGGKTGSGGVGDVTSKMARAEFIVFPDGRRIFRDGSGRAGAVPKNRNVHWTTGIHMPRWAARETLIVDRVWQQRLQEIGREDMRAEGELSTFCGFWWRWSIPMLGLRRDPQTVFSAIWDARHATKGETWNDNPEVVVIQFHRE